MEMWAIGYKHEDDVFVDFIKEEDGFELGVSNLLPTKALVEQYIEDVLGRDYFPIPVKLISFKNGVTDIEYSTPSQWKYEDDEEFED